MLRVLIITGFCGLLNGQISAQSIYLDTLYSFTLFQNIFDQNGGCLQLNDSTYIISATTISYNAQDQLILFTINMNGDTLWSRSFGDTAVGHAYAVRSIFDKSKNIVGAGFFWLDSVNYGHEAMLFKADSAGNFKWLHAYGLPSYGPHKGMEGVVPVATFDDQYLCFGQLGVDSPQFGADSVATYFVVIKTDSNGLELSRWQYGYDHQYQLPTAAIETQDSGFLFVGATTASDSPYNNAYSIYIIKTDKNGNESWNQAYSAPRDSRGYLIDDAVAYDLLEDSDGYVLAGHRFARLNEVFPYSPLDFEKAWIGKLNKADGTLIWEQNIGSDTSLYQLFYKIIKTRDGGYAACGYFVYDAYLMLGGSWIVKTNEQGDSLWCRRFYYANDDSLTTEFYNILQTADNGYIVTGYASPNNTFPYPWVIITDSMGCLIPGCDTITAISSKASADENVGVTVYPNPSGNIAYLLMKSDLPINDLSFKIYNMSGQLITTQNNAVTDATYILHTSGFAAGVYLIDVYSGGKVVAERKLVKQ